MRATIKSASTEEFLPVIENAAANGRYVLICEHASNHIPDQWGELGLTDDQRAAHIAWDPGALGLARALANRLDAVLIHAPISRLVYDCNRAPDMPGAVAVKSEVHEIPGNVNVSLEERLYRTKAVYLPWCHAVHGLIVGRIALGLCPAVLTIHSFTPVYFGKLRRVEFGVIHDDDASLAVAIHSAAMKATRLQVELNAPYAAVDDVTHTLRVQATPYGLPNAMLEIRNDLIATPEAQSALADQLAPVLNMGLVEIQKQAKAS